MRGTPRTRFVTAAWERDSQPRLQHTVRSQGVTGVGAEVGGERPFDSGRERRITAKFKRRGESKSGSSFQWAAAGIVWTTLLVAGGGWIRDLQADGDVESQPGPSPPGSNAGSLVGEDAGWTAPPRVEYDFDYSESSGSLCGSARWSGHERPSNDLLGNRTRAERDIARVDAVLAGQRPVARRVARFEHASLGVSNPDEDGNVWNVGRGFDLRDLHRIELEEEPTARLLSPDCSRHGSSRSSDHVEKWTAIPTSSQLAQRLGQPRHN